MYNYFIELHKEEQIKERERINKINKAIKQNSKRQENLRYNNYEGRVKNFNYDVHLINNKVNENVDYSKSVIRRSLMSRLKLNPKQAEVRMNAGTFSKNNEKRLREWLLNNEVYKYISNQNKKTYFKSVEYVFLGDLFSKHIGKDEEEIEKINHEQSKRFMKVAKRNPDPIDLDPYIFFNPIKKQEEKVSLYSNDNEEKLKKVKEMIMNNNVEAKKKVVFFENNNIANTMETSSNEINNNSHDDDKNKEFQGRVGYKMKKVLKNSSDMLLKKEIIDTNLSNMDIKKISNKNAIKYKEKREARE